MVNLDWEFPGIPNHNNSGYKNIEVPRNSQKFQVYSQQDLEFLEIPTQRTLKSCTSKKFLGNFWEFFQEFLGMFNNYWEF